MKIRAAIRLKISIFVNRSRPLNGSGPIESCQAELAISAKHDMVVGHVTYPISLCRRIGGPIRVHKATSRPELCRQPGR